MIALICGQLLNTWIVYKNVDNEVNYLLRAVVSHPIECMNSEPITGEVEISYSGEDLGGKEGDRLLVNVDAKCEKILKYVQATESYGFYYYGWICNADKVRK